MTTGFPAFVEAIPVEISGEHVDWHLIGAAHQPLRFAELLVQHSLPPKAERPRLVESHNTVAVVQCVDVERLFLFGPPDRQARFTALTRDIARACDADDYLVAN